MPQKSHSKYARKLMRRRAATGAERSNILNRKDGTYTGYNDQLEPLCMISRVDESRLKHFQQSRTDGFKIGDWFVAHEGSGNPFRIVTGPFISSSDAIEFCTSQLGARGFQYQGP